jgi:hypothetical protein
MQDNQPTPTAQPAADTASAKKPYETPQLQTHGAVEELTQIVVNPSSLPV